MTLSSFHARRETCKPEHRSMIDLLETTETVTISLILKRATYTANTADNIKWVKNNFQSFDERNISTILQLHNY